MKSLAAATLICIALGLATAHGIRVYEQEHMCTIEEPSSYQRILDCKSPSALFRELDALRAEGEHIVVVEELDASPRHIRWFITLRSKKSEHKSPEA